MEKSLPIELTMNSSADAAHEVLLSEYFQEAQWNEFLVEHNIPSEEVPDQYGKLTDFLKSEFFREGSGDYLGFNNYWAYESDNDIWGDRKATQALYEATIHTLALISMRAYLQMTASEYQTLPGYTTEELQAIYSHSGTLSNYFGKVIKWKRL